MGAEKDKILRDAITVSIKLNKECRRLKKALCIESIVLILAIICVIFAL